VDVLRTVDASSALSERDRLRVAGLRADIKNNVTSQIPDDLRPYVRDLLGPTPEEIAAEAQATSREILASVQQMQDTDISAAVALDWQREHSLALAKEPLSRELRQAMAGATVLSSAELDARMVDLGFHPGMRIALALEASSKGLVRDEPGYPADSPSDELRDAMTGQDTPMAYDDFVGRCTALGYDITKTAALGLEASKRGLVHYGDKKVSRQTTRSTSGNGHYRLRQPLQAMSDSTAGLNVG
jgi:hypothetical protein